MAPKRVTPPPKIEAKQAQHAAEVKAAAKAAPSDDNDRTFTHQGPGTGAAGAVDPQASSAILRSGKGAAPVVEPKGAAPAVEPKTAAPAAEAKAAAPVAETKAAAAETAAQNLRDRAADDRLKLGASGDDQTTTIPQPKLPGQQNADSGTASHTPGAGGGVSSSSGGATSSSDSSKAAGSAGSSSSGGTSEGANNPFGAAPTDRLDAAAAGALSQLDAARPNLRGGLDVFQSAPGGSTTPSGSGFAGRAGLDGPPAASDPGAEHAADVAGQVTGGRGSTGSLLGDRMAGVQSDLAIAGGLIGDQAARESSPSAAHGGNPIVDRALSLAEKAADGDDDAYRKLERLADEMHKGQEAPAESGAGTGYGFVTNADGELVAPAGEKSPGAESPFWKAVADTFMGTRDLSGKGTVRGEALKQALEDQDQLEDPGDPNNPDGGKPTPAQIAFRQSLRDALGANPSGGGDVDPADSTGAPTGVGVFAGASNDNLGLVGQPNETRTTGGTMRGPTTGTDVDPVEGSAFSGPALGGNPEDLQFGTTTLGIDAARRSTTIEDEDEDEEDDDA